MAGCITGSLSVQSGAGCPAQLTGLANEYVYFDGNGNVCTRALTASLVPALNPNNIPQPNNNVQAQLDYLTARVGATSTMRAGAILGQHIHNSGAPGATDYIIDTRAAVLPYDNANCGLINGQAVGTNVQNVIDLLCARLNQITVHPAATVAAGSNPALTIDLATQVATLNLAAAGSYDNTVCPAVRGTAMPTNVQGAITTLCTALNAFVVTASTSSLVDGPATAAGTQTKIHNNGATPNVAVQFCEGFDTITRTDTCPVAFDDTRRLVSDITFAGKTFQMTRIPDHTSICGRTNLGQPSQEFADPRETLPPGAIAAPTPAASGGGAVNNILITNDGALVIQNPSTCRTMRVEMTVWDRVRIARYTDNASSTAEGESTALSNIVTLVRVNGGAYQSAGQTRDQTVNRPPGERDYYSSQDKTGPQPICFDIAPGGAATIDTAMGLTHFGAGNGNWSWHSFLYNNPGFTWKGTTV